MFPFMPILATVLRFERLMCQSYLFLKVALGEFNSSVALELILWAQRKDACLVVNFRGIRKRSLPEQHENFPAYLRNSQRNYPLIRVSKTQFFRRGLDYCNKSGSLNKFRTPLGMSNLFQNWRQRSSRPRRSPTTPTCPPYPPSAPATIINTQYQR